MNNVLFANVTELKDSGIIDKNIQDIDIMVSIRKVQSTVIQSVLGTNLYDRIVDEITSDSVSDAVKILLDAYIFEAIAYLTKADLQLELSFRTCSTGLQSTNDETKTNAFLSEIKYIKQHNDNTAQFYVNRMEEFIKAYKEQYPEYCTVRDKSDMKPQNKYQIGMNL